MKQKIKSIGASILATSVWLFIGLDTFLVFLSILLLSPFDRNQRLAYRIANLWGKSIVRVNPMWNMKIEGRDHIQPKKGYVLVANHSSLADIVCLYCLGKNFKWLAKESLFKIPFFGWTMSLLNYIPLARGRHGSIRDSFQDAQKWLEKDISVLIFPEGTRSRSGALGEFKNGAFKLAILAQKPIVPIVISGTGETLTRGKATMSAKVRGLVKVLAPIETSSYAPNQFEELRTKVWNLMNEELTA